MGSKSNFAAIFSVLPRFHARILPHFQVKPSPTLRFNAEISTALNYSVVTITSTTKINLLQPPLHRSVIESLFEINLLVLSGREGVTIFCTQSSDCSRHFSFATENRYINTSNLTSMLTSPNQVLHNMSKIRINIPARGAVTHVKTIHLRWLSTVLAVSEYMSFAKSCQENGCSSQAGRNLASEKYTNERFWLTIK